MGPVRTTPLPGTFGVEVKGVGLREPVDRELGGELRSLFFRHHLLVFRDVELEADKQIAFMSLINKVITDPEMPLLEFAAIPFAERFSYISNTELGTYGSANSEQAFHADHMFTPQSAIQAISLYAIEMEKPAPTVFANMVNAVACLPAELRRRVDSLFVENLLSFGSDFRRDSRCRMSNRPADAPNSMYPHAVHPVIERHPVTGEDYLDVSEMMTSHVVGWDDESSDRIFDELAAVSYAPENTYRHEWRVHNFVVWDNIALQHKRGSFPGPGKRTLRPVLANPYELGTLYAAAEMPEWTRARRYEAKL